MRGRARGNQAPATKCFECRRCRRKLFCLFQTRVPHSSTLQNGGKARFAQQNNHFPRGFRVLAYQSSALPPWFPHEAADSAVLRGDGGALIESTPNCGLPASPNHPGGFSLRLYHSFREACGSSQRQLSCTSGLSCSLDRRRSAIQPL